MLKKIAILTTFSSYSEAYSLNRVVMNQIKMLVTNGYHPVVIVGKHFIPVQDYAHPNVEIKRIPDVPCHNEVKCDPTFDQDVGAIERELARALDGVDVCITHDVIYQPACIKHLVASKRIAKRRQDLRWLHWIHSATSPYTLQNLRPMFTDEYINILQEKFPNSFYVFFNHYSIPRIAQNFQINDADVKIVHHPTDIQAFYKIEKETWDLIQKKDMLSADVICVYPARLDRGKQLEKMIKVIASFKQFDKSVRIIIPDFHSTGGDKVAYREELKKTAIDWGLNEQELTFLSEQKAEWNVEVSYKVIADLFRISNVFIMPCVSESYSLITQEAGLSGVAMMVNQDFPPFRDIFGWPPHQVKFSSNIDVLTGLDGETTTTPSNERQYYLAAAGVLNYDLENDRSLYLKTFLRKYRNLQYIFKHELEPLLYYDKPVK